MFYNPAIPRLIVGDFWRKKDMWLVLLATLSVGSPLYWFLSRYFVFYGADWNSTFYPATVLLLHGQNPYLVTTLHNPVWTLFPLIPIVLFGREVSTALMFFLGMLSCVVVAYKLRARPVAVFAFLLSPLVLYSAADANVDLLALFGFWLPAPVGLFFALMKPQIGIAAIAYWGWKAWKEGGIRKVATTFAPVTLALAATFLVFGNWLAGRTDGVPHNLYNFSIFPWSLPLGVALLVLAMKHTRFTDAAAASPLLSFYVAPQSWLFAQLALLPYPLLMCAATVAMWAAWWTLYYLRVR